MSNKFTNIYRYIQLKISFDASYFQVYSIKILIITKEHQEKYFLFCPKVNFNMVDSFNFYSFEEIFYG